MIFLILPVIFHYDVGTLPVGSDIWTIPDERKPKINVAIFCGGVHITSPSPPSRQYIAVGRRHLTGPLWWETPNGTPIFKGLKLPMKYEKHT